MDSDFDSILDRCLAEIAVGRETLESCLHRYPANAAQLAVLLPIAEQARVVPPPAPLAADKRRALEARLLRRADQLRSQPAPRPGVPRRSLWRRGIALAAASFVVVLLLFGSAVSASAASVPGDVLYPVKRAAEQVRLTLASQQEQVDLHLEFARQRLQELRVLTSRGEVSKDLLADMSGDTALILERLPALPQQQQRALLTSLTKFQDQQLQVLEDVASSAPGDAQAAVMAALADSAAKREQAVELLAGATPTGSPGDDSGQEPPSTILTEEAQPPHGKPASTDKPRPPAAAKATQDPPAMSQKPTPDAEHTPPGQAKQLTPQSPPGQAKQFAPQSLPDKPKKNYTK